MELLVSFLPYSGLASLGILFVIWLARNWISEKIKKRIEHDYNSKLKKIENDLKNQSEKIKLATSFIGESQKIMIERRLNATDMLWSKTLEVKNNTPALINMIDVFTTEEYKSALESPKMKSLLDDYNNKQYDIVLKASSNMNEVSQVRPYIGEYLWTLFATYQRIFLRIPLLLSDRIKNKDKLNLYSDKMIESFIHSSMNNAEIMEFEALQYNKTAWIQAKYEMKILDAIKKLMSAQDFGEEAIRQTEIMEKTIRENEAIGNQL